MQLTYVSCKRLFDMRRSAAAAKRPPLSF